MPATLAQSQLAAPRLTSCHSGTVIISKPDGNDAEETYDRLGSPSTKRAFSPQWDRSVLEPWYPLFTSLTVASSMWQASPCTLAAEIKLTWAQTTRRRRFNTKASGDSTDVAFDRPSSQVQSLVLSSIDLTHTLRLFEVFHDSPFLDSAENR